MEQKKQVSKPFNVKKAKKEGKKKPASGAEPTLLQKMASVVQLDEAERAGAPAKGGAA